MKKFFIVIVVLFYSFLGVQMLLADTTPNHFKFINQKNVALSTPITSNTITVSGIDTAAPISIVGGDYSINGGGYTSSSGTVTNGNTVTLQLMSAASFSTTTTATLTIGGVSGAFSVKTLPADTKPDKFTFTPQTGVELDTVITSNAIMVSGINTVTDISIVGGTYSINGGPYTSAPGTGTVNEGDTVTVRQTSAGSYGKKTTATLTIGKVKGAFSVTTLRLTQADLTGTWRMNLLRTGSDTKWERGRVSIDSSGVMTCLSYSTSGGGTCPSPFDLKLTMHSATGVITESGANASTNSHLMMTSNKNFMVGTGTNDSHPGRSYQLLVVQKDTGDTYSAAAVQNKSFVVHQLEVGASGNGWRYSSNTTDAAGAVTCNSETTPSGTTGPYVTGVTFSVDSNGVVTASPGMDTYQGFLADDKKTIVATFTDGTVYKLQIAQITGQTYTDDALSGTWYAHMLTTLPSWIHFTAAIASDGVFSFSHWVSSYSGSSGPKTTTTFKINSSGAITLAEDASFHGQMSDDGKFMVTTQTMNGPSDYGFDVYTR